VAPLSALKVKPKGILEHENVCEPTNQEMLKFKVKRFLLYNTKAFLP
jgi:hypothetical protein